MQVRIEYVVMGALQHKTHDEVQMLEIADGTVTVRPAAVNDPVVYYTVTNVRSVVVEDD